MRNLATTLARLAVAGTALAPVLAAQQASVYDAVQAERGRRVLGAHCASCHGNDLDGGVGPALAGAAFLHTWSEKGAGSLFSITRTSMPRPAVGSLSAEVVRGTADGYLVALDAADGSLLWARQVAKPALGETITMPPLVFEDLAIIGPAGSENNVQGWIGAFRLTDGERVWRFNTIPRQGEPGSGT